ncbi:hypothetical protein Ddye_004950 [Dipteronia dyeriana]|uniref:B box-type domain-containing protein n=1 Tax=Dipteronia dyeriana TaxID=168575 RepID=A0AAD9XFM3_9ROSI|nr:hypothetical protein Ddye_004950 [Dipteronia dyeriana]
MKIQCEVCEAAEAEVLCCADEAVLCWGCDVKVHTANKLSQKHQRVSLLKHHPASSSSHPPLCDVCQERSGYFFCLEDRAILCKQCDMSTHTTMPSSYVSSHQRFLIGAIKVSLESSTDTGFILSNFPTCHADSTATMTLGVEANFTASGEPHLSTTASWSLDDILDTNDFTSYDFSDMESSRISGQ